MTWTFKVFRIISISCPYQDRWMGTCVNTNLMSSRFLVLLYLLVSPKFIMSKFPQSFKDIYQSDIQCLYPLFKHDVLSYVFHKLCGISCVVKH